MEQSYKIHDGCWVAMFGFGDNYGGVLSSLQAIEDDWLRWQKVSQECGFESTIAEPKGPIKPQQWNPRWLPVTDACNGNAFCIDLDPAPGGTLGQIFWYDRVYGPIQVIAGGFGEWLEQYAVNLESGNFEFDSDGEFIDRQAE
jgi:cell wall assembly regulator SMI1